MPPAWLAGCWGKHNMCTLGTWAEQLTGSRDPPGLTGSWGTTQASSTISALTEVELQAPHGSIRCHSDSCTASAVTADRCCKHRMRCPDAAKVLTAACAVSQALTGVRRSMDSSHAPMRWAPHWAVWPFCLFLKMMGALDCCSVVGCGQSHLQAATSPKQDKLCQAHAAHTSTTVPGQTLLAAAGSPHQRIWLPLTSFAGWCLLYSLTAS